MSSMIPGVPDKAFTVELGFDKDKYAFPYIHPNLKPSRLRDTTGDTPVMQTGNRAFAKLKDRGSGLDRLKVSQALWPNLIYYADPTRSRPVEPFERHTLNATPNGKTEATPVSTAWGARGMFNAGQSFMDWEWRPTFDVDVRRDVYAFLEKFTNYAILQRYRKDPKKIRGLVLEPSDSFEQDPFRHHLGWRGNELSDDDLFFNDDQPNSVRLTALADALLDSHTGSEGICAVMQAKPSSSYTETDLRGVYEGAVIDNHRTFNWEADSVSVNLIKQLWGSMVIMCCDFAIWTNGEKVFFAVRTAQNELVITPPMDWAQTETTKAVIGLAYAALDQKLHWVPSGIDIRGELVGHTELIVKPRRNQ